MSTEDGEHTAEALTAAFRDIPRDVLAREFCEDSSCTCMIMDGESLQVLYANRAAKEALGERGRAVAGARLGELYPRPVAEERSRFIHEAGESDRPITVMGMLRGKWSRTSYVPFLDADSSRRRVMDVTCSCTEHTAARCESARRARRAEHDDLGQLARLSERELEVLRLVGLGLSTAQIGQTLDRSVKTVEGHRLSLANKLNIRNRVELARLATSSGLTLLNEEQLRDIAKRAQAVRRG